MAFQKILGVLIELLRILVGFVDVMVRKLHRVS